MSTLNTTYMGIPLKNPIIVGASNLINDPVMVKKMEEAGAAAIVYKSLFEEQIQLESYELGEALTEYYDRNAEMTTLFPDMVHAGPEEHLLNLKKLVDSVNIPVFASLNAVDPQTWVDWALRIEATGVAGLEINFYAVPKSFQKDALQIENEQIQLLHAIKTALKIPVAVKLSGFYTNTLHLLSRMDKVGANAFVLFNSLFQPDINIDTEKLHFPYYLSHEGDNRLALRYAGLLYGNIKGDICSNTGIHHGSDLIKMILAGAGSVQIVSTIFRHGAGQITVMLDELKAWMESKKYQSIDDFKGKLSRSRLSDPYAYRRAQYIDILMRSSDIFKKYPVV
jgi:dihydroorotate dehydrogenase (fumarate)